MMVLATGCAASRAASHCSDAAGFAHGGTARRATLAAPAGRASKGQEMATQVPLRPSYDRRLLQVLALLQAADPPPAMAVAASCESIWAILSTPAKLAAI